MPYVYCTIKAKFLAEDEMWFLFSFSQKEKNNKTYLPPKFNIAASLLIKKATKFFEKKLVALKNILNYKVSESKVPPREGFREALNIYTFQF